LPRSLFSKKKKTKRRSKRADGKGIFVNSRGERRREGQAPMTGSSRGERSKEWSLLPSTTFDST